MENNLQFMDTEGVQGITPDTLNFKFILLMHLREITRLSCCEFMGGFWELTDVVGKGGVVNTMKKYYPDSRAKYCNAVSMLHDLLLPYFDEEMQKTAEVYDMKLRSKFKALNEKELDAKDLNHKFSELKLKNKRFLFQALSKLMKRNGYLEIRPKEST